jgi:hypothetical protein
MSSGDDFVRRFLLEDLDIRGAVVRLTSSWREMQAGRGYPGAIVRLLGEMSAVALLIGANLKQPGRLSFQLQGHGPVSLLLIDCTQDLAFRGVARYGDLPVEPTMSALLGDGRLALTLHSELVAQPYQSLVPLQGEGIAAVFEHYLAQSEQQPARLWLFADGHSATGRRRLAARRTARRHRARRRAAAADFRATAAAPLPRGNRAPVRPAPGALRMPARLGQGAQHAALPGPGRSGRHPRRARRGRGAR